MQTVTVVIPCYDEEANIQEVYDRVVKALVPFGQLELLFVDDGSSDGTLHEIRRVADLDPRVSYLSFTRNFGLEAAFTAGFKYATGDWVLQLDADLQSPPEEAHKLFSKAAEGYDAVFAVRDRRRDPWWRRTGSTLQQMFAHYVLAIELPVGASVFRLVRADVARRIATMPLGTRYFIATLPLVTGSYTTVLTEHAPRRSGDSKFRVLMLLVHTSELFYGFSSRPLLLSMALLGLGSLSALVGFAAAGLAMACAAMAAMLPYVRIGLRKGKALGDFYVREANFEVLPDDRLGVLSFRTEGARARQLAKG